MFKSDSTIIGPVTNWKQRGFYGIELKWKEFSRNDFECFWQSSNGTESISKVNDDDKLIVKIKSFREKT